MPYLSELNICFLAGTLSQGGAEHQLLHALKTLKEHGARVRLLCLTQGEFWEEPIRELGVEVTWVGQDGSRWGRLRRIVAELRRDPPQIVQSQHFFANWYTVVGARLAGALSVGAMRSDGSRSFRESGPVVGWFNLLGPGFMAANSQQAIDFALRRGRRACNVHFLPNVTDTVRFRPPVNRPDGPLMLIAVGRLGPEKRFDRFIRVLAAARRESGQDLRGMIVGHGRVGSDLRSDLEAQAVRLGLLPGALEFKGSVKDTASLYRQSNICVLTSDYEGTPNVLLEAMACALPIVATRVGGVENIVEHGVNGYLVERDDEQALLRFVRSLSENAAMRQQMGRNGREFIMRTRTLERLPALLAELYSKALGTPVQFSGSGSAYCSEATGRAETLALKLPEGPAL